MSDKRKVRIAWDTNEQLEQEIADIKDKIALQEKHDNAFLCHSKSWLQDMEDKKAFIKSAVFNNRRELARCLNGDREVIISALQDSPLDQLTYQRSTAEKCIIEKNQDVFDQVKKLNNLQHAKNMKQKKIEDLETHLKSLKSQEVIILGAGQTNTMQGGNEDESEQRLRVLSTKLDKVLLKINSARYVNTTYKRLLSYLEKDSLSLPGRLDNLEAYLERQKKELRALRITANEAKVACDDTRRKRSSLEQEIMQDKTVRDKKLTAIRKNLRTLQDEADSFNLQPINLNRKRDLRSRGQNDSSNRMTTFNSDRKVQKEALSGALNILKEIVGASKVEDISTSFESQIHTQKELLDEAEKLSAMKKTLLENLQNAENSIKTSTYESSTKLPENENQDVPEEDNKTQLQQLDSQINLLDQNIVKIIDGINVFYRKSCLLSNVTYNEDISYDQKIKLIVDTFSSLSIKYDLESPQVQNKIDLQRKDSNTSDKMATILHAISNTRIVLPDPEEENNQPETRNTTRGPDKNDKSLFNDEDEELDVNFHSRDDIKKKAKEILNLARPKKGKARK